MALNDTLIGVEVNDRRSGMNFAVYSKEGCPYCDKIKEVFKGKSISYREYILDHHFSRRAFYDEFGQGSTFPQVVCDVTNIGGCNETVKYLQERKLV